jgi:hypothetical protein
MRLPIIEVSLICVTLGVGIAQESSMPTVPIGLFFGRIEEGARIFTPVRLLPFEHPESEGHQFPNALQLYGTEFDVLLWLGHQAGYELRATLMRYPKQPSPSWPYKEFSPPDTSALRSARCVMRSSDDAPFKGLRAVLFVNREPTCFIVDTRNLTLEERGMTRASTMGLDMNRADFLRKLDKASAFVPAQSTAAVIFGQ